MTVSKTIDDFETLVRRCRTKSIKKNKEIHKNAFFSRHPNISVDRSKYRSHKDTLKGIPSTDKKEKWCLVEGIARKIKGTKGVRELKADSLPDNPAHALIVRNEGIEQSIIASGLVKEFKVISN